MINLHTFPLYSGFTWSNPQHLAADSLTYSQIAKQHVWVATAPIFAANRLRRHITNKHARECRRRHFVRCRSTSQLASYLKNTPHRTSSYQLMKPQLPLPPRNERTPLRSFCFEFDLSLLESTPTAPSRLRGRPPP